MTDSNGPVPVPEIQNRTNRSIGEEMTETPTTFCAVCDSETDCGHNGHRYLDDIVYEPVGGGWRASEADRERWLKRPDVVSVRAEVEVLPVQRLVVELEEWVFMDSTLEAQLRSAYEHNPGRTASAVAYVVDQAQQGKLRSPGGLLVNRLREIEARDAA